MSDLNEKILIAHEQGDHYALVDLYAAAADQAMGLDARCYFLTIANVFALEQNHPRQSELHSELKAHGREE